MAMRANADIQPFSYSDDLWIPARSPNDVRIRLIELHPGEKEAPLQCRLSWTSLSAHVPFKALSYAWGNGIPISKCYIDNKFLSITPSLEAALQHVRHQSEPVIIWADQISINQSDVDEKNEQVANMSRIYPGATEVIVWLGSGTKESDTFMDTFNEIGNIVVEADLVKYLYVEDQMAVVGRILGNVDPTDPETINFQTMVNTVMHLMTRGLLEGLISWTKRPWFSRVCKESSTHELNPSRILTSAFFSRGRTGVCAGEVINIHMREQDYPNRDSAAHTILPSRSLGTYSIGLEAVPLDNSRQSDGRVPRHRHVQATIRRWPQEWTISVMY
jgi:hypothetical protein